MQIGGIMPLVKTDKLRTYLENARTFGTTLLAILFDNYGTEIQHWEPETLIAELRESYGANPPRVNLDKIWGMITALTTDLFYLDPLVFNGICQALNNEESDFSYFNPISCEGAAWGIAEVTMNDMEPEATFSDEVAGYVGALLDYRGLVTIPPILKMAKPSKKLLAGIREYADDPAVFEALMLVQDANSREITSYVQNRTQELLTELQGLPLKNPVDLSGFNLKAALEHESPAKNSVLHL